MTSSAYFDWLGLFERCAEAVSLSTPKQPTLAIANPPFGKSPQTYTDLEKFELGHSWKQQNGSFTRSHRIKSAAETEVLFTELCIRCLQPGEVVVLLIPNGLLNAPGTLYARKWIETHTQIIASIQLPPEVWKAECNLALVTSLLVLRRKAIEEPETDYNIFMAVPKTCGYDNRRRKIEQTDLPKVLSGFEAFCRTQSNEGESDRPFDNA